MFGYGKPSTTTTTTRFISLGSNESKEVVVVAESPTRNSASEMKCTNCGYEWQYSGEMMQATCPSCQRKTPVEDDEE